MALRASRKPSGVDLLSDGGDDSTSTWTPRVIAITAVISVCLIGVVIWAIASKRNDYAGVPVEQMTPVKDQLVERTPAPTKAQPAAPVPLATPVILPAPQQQRISRATNDIAEGGGGGSNLNLSARSSSATATINLGDREREVGPDPFAVRLSGGLLRLNASRRVVSGRVAIVNTSENNVTEYRLEAEINGKSYPLVPFEGTPDKPRALKSPTIGPGEKVSLPVMVSKFTGSKKSGIVPAKITMEAWLDYGSSVQKDTILTP